MARELLEDYTDKNSKYAVDYDHVKIPVKDFCDTINLDDDNDDKKNDPNRNPTPYELLKILDKMSISDEELSLWVDMVNIHEY